MEFHSVVGGLAEGDIRNALQTDLFFSNGFILAERFQVHNVQDYTFHAYRPHDLFPVRGLDHQETSRHAGKTIYS